MKSILCGIAFVLLSSAVVAQSHSFGHMKPDHYFGTFGVGANFQTFNGLNDRVSGLPQYKDLRDHAASLNLGWIKDKNRVVSLFNVGASSSLSGDRNRQSSVVRSIGVAGDIGYDVIKKERIMLYPMVGIGYEWVQAKFYTDNSRVDFDDVLTNPTVRNNIEPVRFSNGFFNYRLGAGVQFLSPKGDGTIGIHGGYVGSFQSREWRGASNQDLANAPEDRLKRFYVTLVFGRKPMR